MKNIQVIIRSGNYMIPIEMINPLNVKQLGNGFAIEVDVENINTIGYAKLNDVGLFQDAMPNDSWYPEYDEFIDHSIDQINNHLRNAEMNS